MSETNPASSQPAKDEAAKPAEGEAPKPTFTFGSTAGAAAPAFNFGTPSGGAAAGSAMPKFTFGSGTAGSSGAAPAFSFPGVAPISSGAGAAAGSKAGSGDGAKDEGDASTFEPTKHYEPLVSLPEVEVRTHEEDETPLLKLRAKLFRFDRSGTQQWKERGIGDVKLLQHKESKKIRLLMRREKTLKVCANHRIDPAIKLQENVSSDRSWVWTAMDYADGELKEEIFAIRFQNAENAKLFRAKYEECQEALSAKADGKPMPEIKPYAPPAQEEDEAKPGAAAASPAKAAEPAAEATKAAE